jgi:hypothetical protein
MNIFMWRLGGRNQKSIIGIEWFVQVGKKAVPE